MAEKVFSFLEHNFTVHNKRMAVGNHHKIAHPLELGTGNTYFAVIIPLDQGGIKGIKTKTTGYNPHLKCCRAKLGRDAISSGAQLATRRAVDKTKSRPTSKLVNDLTAIIGRAQHHHPAKFSDDVLVKIIP